MDFSNQKLEKINIVCSGGEVKGGFVGGFLDSFVTETNLDNFEITFYCVSASVPTVLYYLSHGLDHPGREIWVKKLSKEGRCVYNSFLHIDFSGIIRVFRDYPYRVENILNNRHEIIFAIYNIDKRKVEYVSSKKRKGYIWMGDFNIYDLVQAAIAAPVLYGKSVRIGNYKYCDPALVMHCIIPDDKNKTIYILQNKSIPESKFVFIFMLISSMFSSTLPYFIFSLFIFDKKKIYKKVKKLVKQKKAILVEPVKKLVGGLNMCLTEKDLNTNYTIGSKSFSKNNLKIVKFLQK